MMKPEFQDFEKKSLPTVTRHAVSLSQGSVIKTSYLQSGQTLPLVMQPAVEGIDLPTWAGINRELIETNLLKHGGILFRGFEMKTLDDFEQCLQAICAQLMHYIEGATPRTELSNYVYTSTEYPPDQSIALHNELTYVVTWPMRIWFFCVTPAQEGGETPIADVRKVLARIDPKIKERFTQNGWRLVRNYGEGLSLSWQKAFRTSDKSQVETYCRAAQIEYEWRGGDRLRTYQVRPAVVKHPRTSEMVWFNHIAFWHISSLEPKIKEAMSAMLKEEDLPYNTYYGDGSPIEESVVEELREAYSQETVAFSWQKGDLLMLDNILVAHGRNPYAGPRKILVAMGESCDHSGQLM